MLITHTWILVPRLASYYQIGSPPVHLQDKNGPDMKSYSRSPIGNARAPLPPKEHRQTNAEDWKEEPEICLPVSSLKTAESHIQRLEMGLGTTHAHNCDETREDINKECEAVNEQEATNQENYSEGPLKAIAEEQQHINVGLECREQPGPVQELDDTEEALNRKMSNAVQLDSLKEELFGIQPNSDGDELAGGALFTKDVERKWMESNARYLYCPRVVFLLLIFKSNGVIVMIF